MNQEICFVREIPGFPGLTRFTLERSDENWPFATLQSLENEKVGFILSDPFALFSDYQIDLAEDIVTDLEVQKPGEVLTWGIITYRASLPESTINLQAPVIINTRTWKATQIILSNPAYLVRQPLTPIIESEVALSADSSEEDSQLGGQTNADTNAQEG